MSAVEGAMMASSRSFKGIELEPTYCYAPNVEYDRGEKLAET